MTINAGHQKNLLFLSANNSDIHLKITKKKSRFFMQKKLGKMETYISGLLLVLFGLVKRILYIGGFQTMSLNQTIAMSNALLFDLTTILNHITGL